MDDQALLSDLCRICNDATPKYCCPRCNTKTCSLQCYKRHQTWSQCSGKRDPGAYVKRSQLATPAGIDHDFNFLSGIERAFETADRDAGGRGIGVEAVSTGRRRYNGPTKGSNLQRGLAASGAVIRKAPVGMSRQKANKTGYSGKNRCLMWTVEWVNPDGTKGHGQCRENLPLDVLYHNFAPQHCRPRKRQIVGEDDSNDALGEEERARKTIKISAIEKEANEDDQAVPGQLDEIAETYQRMVEESKARYDAAHNPPDEVMSIPTTIEVESSHPRSSEPTPAHPSTQSTCLLPNTESFMVPSITDTTIPEPILSSAVLPTPDITAEQAPTPMEVNTPALPQTDNGNVTVPPSGEDILAPQQLISTSPPQPATNDVPPHPPHPDPNETTPQTTTNDTTLPATTNQETTPPPSLCPGLHFYLHKPSTTSPHPVLIPLSPHSTLETCLQNRLILEYPTIYVLPQPASELPDTFLLEVEYHKREKKMIEELDQDERELGVGQLPVENSVTKGRDEEGDVEEARVLESLKRDLLAAGRLVGE